MKFPIGNSSDFLQAVNKSAGILKAIRILRFVRNLEGQGPRVVIVHGNRY